MELVFRKKNNYNKLSKELAGHITTFCCAKYKIIYKTIIESWL